MIPSISNIAWAPEDRLAAYRMMNEAGLDGLEIAPGLLFAGADDPLDPGADLAKARTDEISAHGLTLVSMQSLLFGVQGAALFGDPDERAAFERGMTRAIAFAGRFGIPNLVFGSPKQRRVPETMPMADAIAIASQTFRALGDKAAAEGCVLTIEANPPAYGTNFLNTLDETEAFVAEVDHQAVSLILDLGAMHLNGVFAAVPSRLPALDVPLNHVHVSEPNLDPAPLDPDALIPVLKSLRATGYARAVSIEMKKTDDGLDVVRSKMNALARAFAAATEDR